MLVFGAVIQLLVSFREGLFSGFERPAFRRHAVGMNEHLRKSLQESDADGNGNGYQGKLSEGFDICKKGFRRD